MGRDRGPRLQLRTLVCGGVPSRGETTKAGAGRRPAHVSVRRGPGRENSYGDLAPWSPTGVGPFTLLSFLNVTKYPPSLLYTAMTLGPALIVLALAERKYDGATHWTAIFGRVPLFFYMATYSSSMSLRLSQRSRPAADRQT